MSARISELAWTEYDRRIREDAPVVLLPVGSLEQHGPHLPMNCDALIPTVLAERVAAGAGHLVAPTISYGYKSQPKSGGGNHFPGTTSLDGHTLSALVRDVIKEFARHGVRKLALMDGHYENNMFLVEGIDLALRELRRDGIDDLLIANIGYWEFTSKATLDRVFVGSQCFCGQYGFTRCNCDIGKGATNIDGKAGMRGIFHHFVLEPGYKRLIQPGKTGQETIYRETVITLLGLESVQRGQRRGELASNDEVGFVVSSTEK